MTEKTIEGEYKIIGDEYCPSNKMTPEEEQEEIDKYFQYYDNLPPQVDSWDNIFIGFIVIILKSIALKIWVLNHWGSW